MQKIIYSFILLTGLVFAQNSASGQDIVDSTMKQSDSLRVGKLSKKQVREILASGLARPRNDLWTTKSDSMFNFYELEDKRFMIVLMFEEVGVLYESYQAMRDMLQKSQDRYKKQFPNAEPTGLGLTDMIVSDAKNFELLAPQSGRKLAELLKIPADSLDFSVNSLALIDRELSRQLKPKDRMDLFGGYFTLLYAYMGEILRRGTEGTWKLEEEDGKLSSATIVDKRGRTYSPHKALVEEFFEGTGKFKLKISIEAELVHNDMFKQ